MQHRAPLRTSPARKAVGMLKLDANSKDPAAGFNSAAGSPCSNDSIVHAISLCHATNHGPIPVTNAASPSRGSGGGQKLHLTNHGPMLPAPPQRCVPDRPLPLSARSLLITRSASATPVYTAASSVTTTSGSLASPPHARARIAAVHSAAAPSSVSADSRTGPAAYEGNAANLVAALRAWRAREGGEARYSLSDGNACQLTSVSADRLGPAQRNNELASRQSILQP